MSDGTSEEHEENVGVIKIVQPKNVSKVKDRPAISRGNIFTSGWGMDLWRLKKRYELCDVVNGPGDDLTITLLHVPTDPDFQKQWLDDGVNGLLFSLQIPHSFVSGNYDGSLPTLSIAAPNTPLHQKAASKLNILLGNVLKEDSSHSVYNALQQLDRYYMVPVFLEVAAVEAANPTPAFSSGSGADPRRTPVFESATPISSTPAETRSSGSNIAVPVNNHQRAAASGYAGRGGSPSKFAGRKDFSALDNLRKAADYNKLTESERSGSVSSASGYSGRSVGSSPKQKKDFTPSWIESGEDVWTPQEQNDLEDALQRADKQDFPNVKHRWNWIAAKVGSKSAKQCAERFNWCRKQAMGGNDSEGSSQEDVQISLANESSVNKVGLSMDTSGIQMKGIQDLLLAGMDFQVRCNRCRSVNDVAMRGMSSKVSSKRTHCGTCKLDGVVHILPTSLTPLTPSFGKILIEGSALADINIVDCHATCSECASTALLHRVIRANLRQARCLKCHSSQSVKIESFFTGQTSTASAAPKEKGRNKDKNGQNLCLKVGSPLPDNGTCTHYKRSHRWLRFPCCGKAYPCDICHDSKEDHEHIYANRMICGYCSREMAFSNSKSCQCGHAFTKPRTQFWEGGTGTRNRAQMSQNDSHKYKGLAKTTSNKKKHNMDQQKGKK